MATYTVSRQSYVFDDGALAVEVARCFDYMSPGALVERYSGEFEEFADPREAAEAAIAIAKQWRADEHRRIPYTIAGNSYVYPTTADGMNAAELRAWARDEYAGLKKCDHCGDVIDGDTWKHADDFGWDDTPEFCSQNCAEIDSARFDARALS